MNRCVSEFALAAAGVLLRCGVPEDDAARIINSAARVAGDEEHDKRAKAVSDTVQALLAGEPATGAPRLDEISGQTGLADRLRKFLGAGTTGEGAAKETPSATLIAIGRTAHLFHDADGTAWARVKVGDHDEVLKVGPGDFTDWITRVYFQQKGIAPKNNSLSEALSTIRAFARFDGPEERVHVRVAEYAGDVFIDIGSKDHTAIRIGPNGWSITTAVPVNFRRPRGMRALPRPEHSDRGLEALDAHLNLVDPTQRRLVYAFITGSLLPHGPFPILIWHGEQGSSKSTTTRMIRRLVDPAVPPLRGTIHDEQDFIIAANNSWLLAFDNLSRLSPQVSNLLCRVSTGGGFGKRQLYTDQDEVLFDVQRPVILNGITELASRGDLVDRSIVIELAVISEEKRRPEGELWNEFERSAPAIFAGCLDAIAGALRLLPDVHLDRSPRMADFARWGTALGRALGWPEGAFIDAYERNRQAANTAALDSDPVALAVCEFLVERNDGPWEGRASDLLPDLTALAEKIGLSPSMKWWPTTPNFLARSLKRAAPVLRAAGVQVDLGRRIGSDSRKIIRLSKTGAIDMMISMPSGEDAGRRSIPGDESEVFERGLTDGQAPDSPGAPSGPGTGGEPEGAAPGVSKGESDREDEFHL